MRRRWVKGTALETVLALRPLQVGDEILVHIPKGHATVLPSLEGTHTCKVSRVCRPCDMRPFWEGKYEVPCAGVTVNMEGSDRHLRRSYIIGWRPKARPK